MAGEPLVERGSAPKAKILQLPFQQWCRGRQREQAEMELIKSTAPQSSDLAEMLKQSMTAVALLPS